MIASKIRKLRNDNKYGMNASEYIEKFGRKKCLQNQFEKLEK